MGDPNLLLIEENPDDVYLTLRELRKFGPQLRVEVMTDSVAALEHLLEVDRLPSALLLGLRFVHLSGLELLASLRANDRTRRLPVVLLTAGEEERERVARESNGSDPVACLDKPLQFGALLPMLEDLGVQARLVLA